MHNACCLCHSGFKWIKPARNIFNLIDVITDFMNFPTNSQYFGFEQINQIYFKNLANLLQTQVKSVNFTDSSNLISGGFFPDSPTMWRRRRQYRWRHISAPFKRKNNCHPSYFGRIAHLRLCSVEIGKKRLKIFMEDTAGQTLDFITDP